MRTTITLSDAVLAQAKREAERAGVTLGDIVERALRQLLHRRAPAKEPAPFRLVTFGGGGLRPGFSFDRLKGIAHLDEP
jgi:hypothetical protein